MIDFSTLSEDALISAKVVISVIGNDSLAPQESEEFIIRFGQPPEREQGGVGKKVRTFSEGLIELDNRELVSALASSTGMSSRGFQRIRAAANHAQRGKSFRVFRPSLIYQCREAMDRASGRNRALAR